MRQVPCRCGVLKRLKSLRCEWCYRAEQRAVKRCGECGITKPRTEFKTRPTTGAPTARCLACAAVRKHHLAGEPAPSRPERVTQIVVEVAAAFRIEAALILSWDRRRPVFAARVAAMRRCRDELVISGRSPTFPMIGRWFGRDHTSVMNAYYGGLPGQHRRVEPLREAA